VRAVVDFPLVKLIVPVAATWRAASSAPNYPVSSEAAPVSVLEQNERDHAVVVGWPIAGALGCNERRPALHFNQEVASALDLDWACLVRPSSNHHSAPVTAGRDGCFDSLDVVM